MIIRKVATDYIANSHPRRRVYRCGG